MRRYFISENMQRLQRNRERYARYIGQTEEERLAQLEHEQRKRLAEAQLEKKKAELAVAVREAMQRGWTRKIFHHTNSGIYAVCGYDQERVFQIGVSRDGWPAAFEDADRRAQEQKRKAIDSELGVSWPDNKRGRKRK